jgi:hypothetical protein
LRIVGERGRIGKHGNDTPLPQDIRNHAHQLVARTLLPSASKAPVIPGRHAR